MLDKSCLLFIIPAAIGYVRRHIWVFAGCLGLVTTGRLYYTNLDKPIYRWIDVYYVHTYTLLSVMQGLFSAYKGCFINATGVVCAMTAVGIYFTKSERGIASKNDRWHVLVHCLASISLMMMACGGDPSRWQ